MPFAFARFNIKKPRYTEILAIFMIAVVCLTAASNAKAATVVLAWESGSSNAIAGNKVYYGNSSGNYQYSIDAGNYESCSISGLQEGKTYYFAATSYDTSKTESDYSEELVYQIPVSNLDTDNDGITDKDELNNYGTNPKVADTDGDGVKDGEELSYWGNRWNADDDGDGTINLIDYDSDNDGLSDGYEIYSINNPLLPVSTSANELVVDDSGPGTSATGTWKTSSGADPYGSRSLYSKAPGDKYRFEAPVSGVADVMLWWTEHSSRSTSVPVEIYDGSNLIDTVYVDQSRNGGMWNPLGAYTFNGTARVVIVSTSSSLTTSADAVRFVPQYGIVSEPANEVITSSPDEVILDDSGPGTSATGTWKTSSGADPYGSRSLYSKAPGDKYRFEAPVSGVADVMLWWTEHSSRSTSVPVEIYDGSNLIDTVYVDQSRNGGMWNPLGAYTFNGTARVVIVSTSSSLTTSADAVRFVPQYGIVSEPANEVITSSPDEVILDDSDPGTSGTLQNFWSNWRNWRN